MADNQSNEVTIYSTPTCHFCKQAKEFFTEHGVEYTDHNVAEDVEKRKEMVEKSGQMGVPTIVINDKVYVGFDQPKIAEALGISS